MVRGPFVGSVDYQKIANFFGHERDFAKSITRSIGPGCRHFAMGNLWCYYSLIPDGKNIWALGFLRGQYARTEAVGVGTRAFFI